MRIAGLRWDGFRLPLRVPFATAHGTMRAREGLILRLTTEDGVEGLGEVAPLPDFDGATLADCLAALDAIAHPARRSAVRVGHTGHTSREIHPPSAPPGLVGLPLAGLALCLDDLAGRPVPAALRGGLDVAALDAIGRTRRRSIAGLFVAEPRRSIAVNATIGGDEPDAAIAARRAVERGFQTVKVKVGLTADVDAQARRIGAVRQAIGPAVRLRLDANGAWSVPVALRMIEALARFDIALVEQPVAADDLAGLAAVRRSSPVPIAADEAVTGLDAARRILAMGAADYLVIKPAIAGGVTAGRAIADLAAAAGVGAIVTTAIDAGVGIAAALQLAATLPGDTRACGLATAGMLAAPLTRELPQVVGGAMVLPDAPGLGISLDETEFAVYSNRVYGQVGI